MKKKVLTLLFLLAFLFLLTFFILNRGIMTEEKDIINLQLKDGIVVIETRPDLAPNHVKQIKELINAGEYNGVVFHRVIKDFMAQTGDVKYGNTSKKTFNLDMAGTGGSELPNLKAEFSNESHLRGSVSMARSQNPDSANSQFFICFKDCSFLDGQYTVWGQVVEGMKFVDNIKLGEGDNGSVENPDKIIKMEIIDK
tara:strand:- start:277 stop:867 length:591 start_codon:yes stop_codon:yes gene_type:complete